MNDMASLINEKSSAGESRCQRAEEGLGYFTEDISGHVVVFVQPQAGFQDDNIQLGPLREETCEPNPVTSALSRKSATLEASLAFHTVTLRNITEAKYLSAGEGHWTEVRETTFLDCQHSQKPRNLYDPSKLTIGRKIGEGGQGVIYEVLVASEKAVLKVFKTTLSSPQGQWPDELLQIASPFLCRFHGYVSQKDDSVALLMDIYDSDVRTLLNEKMESRSYTGKPFSEFSSMSLIVQIALGMKALHSHGVTHRDLKASNILYRVLPFSEPSDDLLNESVISVCIADFELSSDVVGTGFWRAPEVLQAIQNRKREMISLIYTPKCDVYSFGMLCYEILTGRIPFDEYPRSCYNIVLSGRRPELPTDLYPKLADLICRCWNHDPDDRPTFVEIVAELKQLLVEKTNNSHLLFKLFFALDEEYNSETTPTEAYLDELQEMLHANRTVLTPEVYTSGCQYVIQLKQYLNHYGLGFWKEDEVAERLEMVRLTQLYGLKFRSILYQTSKNASNAQKFRMFEVLFRTCVQMLKPAPSITRLETRGLHLV